LGIEVTVKVFVLWISIGETGDAGVENEMKYDAVMEEEKSQ
jgi:hypothetical protein